MFDLKNVLFEETELGDDVFTSYDDNNLYEVTFGENDGLICTCDSNTETVTISGSDEVKESIISVFDKDKIKYVCFDNCTLKKSINNMFYECSNLIKVDFIGATLSNVKDMSCLFAYCCRLEEVDMSNIETAMGTNINDMFYGCEVQTIKPPKKMWVRISIFGIAIHCLPMILTKSILSIQLESAS